MGLSSEVHTPIGVCSDTDFCAKMTDQHSLALGKPYPPTGKEISNSSSSFSVPTSVVATKSFTQDCCT